VGIDKSGLVVLGVFRKKESSESSFTNVGWFEIELFSLNAIFSASAAPAVLFMLRLMSSMPEALT